MLRAFEAPSRYLKNRYALVPQRNLYCTVILEGKFGETLIKENNTIRIQTDDPLLLIQTDKKIYKPGQKGIKRNLGVCCK